MFTGSRALLTQGGVFAAIIVAATALTAFSPPQEKPRDVPGLLREIQREVHELGPYPGEDFVRRDFSLGEDDDDTNKNHHVGILIQDRDDGPVMTIQITKLEPTRQNPRIRYGKEGRMIVCRLRPDRVEITRSDYRQDELKAVLEEVLKAVRDKKSLLKKRPGSAAISPSAS